MFDDIIGQDNAIFLLKMLKDKERLVQPLLFVGKEGIGKRKTALALAGSINCENGGCNTCNSCRLVNKGIHPDIKEIEPEDGYIKIETIREIIKEAYIMPFFKRRVYIIDNAHFLTEEASNSLLKILEEAKTTLFILITSSPNALLPTILSRCFTVRFKPLSFDSQKEILKREKIEFQKIALELSDGSMSLAIEYSKYDCDAILSLKERLKKEKSLKTANELIELYDRFPNLLSFLSSALRKEGSFSLLDKVLSAKEDIQANVNKRLVLENLVFSI